MISVKKDYSDVPDSLQKAEVEELIRKSLHDKKLPEEGIEYWNSTSVRSKLKEIYHNKCAYCERKPLRGEKLHVDSYRPLSHPKNEYYWLGFEWSNLFLVCENCISAKLGDFPTQNEKVTKPQNDRKEWLANSTTFLNEKPLLINPEIDRPEDIFYFTKDGKIHADDIRGKTSIDIYNLNSEVLVLMRLNTILFNIFEFKRYVELIKKSVVNKDFTRIRFFIQTIIFQFLDRLKKNTSPSIEFSLVYQQLWKNFDEFFIAEMSNKIDEKLARLIFDSYLNRDSINDSEIDTHLQIYLGNGLSSIPSNYLDEVLVENFFYIRNLHLLGLANKKEIYFLGENGDGKTLLLQAILLAMKKAKTEQVSDKQLVGKILQYIQDNPTLELHATDNEGNTYDSLSNNYLENIYAYGSNRNRSNSKKYVDNEGYLTLFYDDKELLDPTEWLKSVKLNEKKSGFKLKTAVKLLEDLLDKQVEIELDGDEVIFKDIRFKEKQTPNLKFEQLSDGYKSVMTWVGDLVARLAEKQPEIKDTKEYKGIVLVDEIGLHLHPKWEAQLVQKLRTWFPEIQFFFTTHSPVMILNASKEAVFYRLYKEDGETKVSEQFLCSDFSDLMMNSLVTSPLFDLEDATMRSFNPEKDELDTADNYRSNRIRKLVKEEVQKQKKAGHKFLSPNRIDDIIRKVIQKNRS